MVDMMDGVVSFVVEYGIVGCNGCNFGYYIWSFLYICFWFFEVVVVIVD